MNHNTLEEELLILQERGQEGPISIEKIVDLLSAKGEFLIILLLSLPFCQPIQIPGLSIPFGIVIIFIGIRGAFRKKIWLPKRLLKKELSPKTTMKITRLTIKTLGVIKRWVHPRMVYLCRHRYAYVVNGVVVAFLAFCMVLPIPLPLVNMPAAISIFLISIGVLEDDGLFLLIGYTASLITTLLFVILIYFIDYFV